MTDLVERLRIEPTAGNFLRIGDMVASLVAERKEAAAEIELLRLEVERLESELDSVYYSISMGQY
jgi:hypothetical protein